MTAIDYIRCSKFSLVWMGHRIGELRELRSKSVGAENGRRHSADNPQNSQVISRLNLSPPLERKQLAVLGRDISDMHSTIREVVRRLYPGGKAVSAIGDNTIRGTYLR